VGGGGVGKGTLKETGSYQVLKKEETISTTATKPLARVVYRGGPLLLVAKDLLRRGRRCRVKKTRVFSSKEKVEDGIKTGVGGRVNAKEINILYEWILVEFETGIKRQKIQIL